MTADEPTVLGLDACKSALEQIDLDAGGSPITSLTALVGPIPVSLLRALELSTKDVEKTKRIQRVVKLFCEKTAQILADPSSVPEDILVSLLRVLGTSSALLREYPVLRKQLAKNVVSVWSSWPSDSVRVVALLTLHHLCSRYSKVFESCLKEMYQQYGRSCRSLSMHNLGQATLMLNGLVEIFALYPEKAVAFGTRCLRQMASLVQQAMKKSDKTNVKKVLCWQFIALVRFWAHLLATMGTESAFKALLFPVCNLLTCVLSFQSSPRFFGFHFHMVASALEMIERTGCHIPVTSCLLKIVGYVAKQPLYKLEVKKAAYDLVALYKVPKSETTTKGYLECVADEALFYILKLLTQQISTVTFPEQANAVLSSLKNVIKNFPKLDRNLKKQIEGHMTKITQQKKEIETLRIGEALTPTAVFDKKSTLQIDNMKQPLIAYVANLEKVRNIKRKLLADKEEEEEEDDQVSTNKASTKKVSSKNAAVDKKSVDKVKKPKQELPASKKRRKTESTEKPSGNKRAAKNVGPEEDIVEDFVLDD
ncbi:hypothetical protein PSACC_01700 [Paramicrosporidium saccamoebae]|uniref:Uncharacterized protein n=1 Tax=Paramicrosporidium saccamoebae TaxID=1246581 RepID=A0A2H9TL79_9FUNG|nr:hypothetical protein PSACC_01700 [Paramicrosporidium saccamoebae]